MVGTAAVSKPRVCLFTSLVVSHNVFNNPLAPPPTVSRPTKPHIIRTTLLVISSRTTRTSKGNKAIRIPPTVVAIVAIISMGLTDEYRVLAPVQASYLSQVDEVVVLHQLSSRIFPGLLLLEHGAVVLPLRPHAIRQVLHHNRHRPLLQQQRQRQQLRHKNLPLMPTITPSALPRTYV